MWSWFALVSVGQAHVGALLESIDLRFPGPSVESNFGLLVSEDGDRFSWICHEAVTAEDALITPAYTRNQAGTWLVAIPAPAQSREADEPVYRSTDLCDWDPVDGLEGLTVVELVFDPNDDTVALALTAGLEGEDNGIYRSVDGGQSFSRVQGVGGSERLFRSLVFVSERPGRVWASAVWYDTSAGWIYLSEDGGQSWSEHAVPVPADGSNNDVDVLAVREEMAWLVVGPFGDDTLLRTSDGESFELVLESEGDLIDGAVDGTGAVWLIASGRRMYRAPDGVSFELVEDPPGGLGVGADSTGGLWASGASSLNGKALYRLDGDTFVSVFHLSELEAPPSSCSAESELAQFCTPLWETLDARLPKVVTDTADTDEDSGVDSGVDEGFEEKACCEGGEGSRAAFLLPFFVLFRRRR